MRFLMALLAAMLWPGAARAEWFEASSAHFVVYADDNERDVRKFSEQLERYHEAMVAITQLDAPPPSPSNRVTVYVVGSQRQIEGLAGSRNVGGFYIPRAGGAVAFVPQIRAQSGEPDWSMVVLLHEYAHHFLISNSGFPAPRWMSEGAADFFAATAFRADGSLYLGMPSDMRRDELSAARARSLDVKVEELIDPQLYENRHGGTFDAFYGKSWLLYHYLAMEPSRRGQLGSYLRGMREGRSARDAAAAAFGDLGQLERELVRYRNRSELLGLVFQPSQLAPPQVALRPLSPGEQAMMPVVIRSKRGVPRERAPAIVAEARAIAARYPGDAAVLAALAEAEHHAGNETEAVAAADAALAIDPGDVDAYLKKGFALFALARQAEDRDAAYRAARAPFLALNKLENDHPQPLIYFNRFYTERGLPPSDIAARALERAAELAPFDLALRLELAIQQLAAGRVAEARGNFLPVAFNPHGGRMADAARLVIERIDAGSPPDERELLTILPRDANGGEGS